MNVFEHAMKMESDGKEYYEEHAAKAKNLLLKKILLELAEDEVKHYNIFKAMRDGQATVYDTNHQVATIKTVKNIFDEMKAQKEKGKVAEEIIQVWEHAREVEKKAEQFYRDKGDELEDEDKRRIFHQIADEEHRHWIMMENVVNFLRKPNDWLENAEWAHLEEY